MQAHSMVLRIAEPPRPSTRNSSRGHSKQPNGAPPGRGRERAQVVFGFPVSVPFGRLHQEIVALAIFIGTSSRHGWGVVT